MKGGDQAPAPAVDWTLALPGGDMELGAHSGGGQGACPAWQREGTRRLLLLEGGALPHLMEGGDTATAPPGEENPARYCRCKGPGAQSSGGWEYSPAWQREMTWHPLQLGNVSQPCLPE